MSNDLLAAFRKALEVLGRSLFVDASAISLSAPGAAVDFTAWDILVAVDFDGSETGTVIFRSAQEVARYLTLVFFGIFVDKDREMVVDGAAEFLNQAAGLVKQNLRLGNDIRFSLPRKIPGRAPVPGAWAVEYSFELNSVGRPIHIDICRPPSLTPELAGGRGGPDG